jgi:hypothetical protein
MIFSSYISLLTRKVHISPTCGHRGRTHLIKENLEKFLSTIWMHVYEEKTPVTIMRLQTSKSPDHVHIRSSQTIMSHELMTRASFSPLPWSRCRQQANKAGRQPKRKMPRAGYITTLGDKMILNEATTFSKY